MKSTLIKALAMALAIMMCAVSFAACGKSGDDETSTTPAPATTTPAPDTTTSATEADTTTEKKDETTTPATTPEETEPPIIDEVATVADGLIVFYEDFNSYADSTDTEAVLKALNWTKLTKEANGVYNETDCEFAFQGGRLYYDNYDTADETAANTAAGDTRVRGKDGYYAINMLNDEYMKPIVAGKYTLQYDLEYIACGDMQRYAVIITECSPDGQCYNSFHFRIRGIANHQCHFYGSWKTFSAYDPMTDLNPPATTDDGSQGTTICKKLLGLTYDDVKDNPNFANVPISLKLQWDPEAGHHVWMKTDKTDWIKVSEPSVNADGMMYIGWDGWSVQFKPGATIDGYIDNIVIWTGWGEQPVGTTVTYKPAA